MSQAGYSSSIRTSMETSSFLLRLSIGLLFVSATLYTMNRVAVHERRPTFEPEEFSYRGRDFPRAWSLPSLEPVHLSHEDSVHYSIETDLGVAEWNATLPSGGTVIHLGPEGRPFTVSFFHQLRCLDIIRDVVVNLYLDTSPDATIQKPALVQHCMNYLRQTVMCRGDLHLETVRAPSGPQVTVSAITHACKDWNAVYEAAEKNYEVYLGMRRSRAERDI